MNKIKSFFVYLSTFLCVLSTVSLASEKSSSGVGDYATVDIKRNAPRLTLFDIFSWSLIGITIYTTNKVVKKWRENGKQQLSP